MTKYTARNFLIAMFATGAVAFAYPALAQTLSELAESCSACHGDNGVPTDKTIPVIWGQNRSYLLNQLHNFKVGHRKNDMMSPVTETLSKTDMEALATHFANLKWPELQQPKPPADAVTEARDVLNTLNCRTCHQEHYQGDTTRPRIAGQQDAYLLQTMTDFRDGKRTTYAGMTSLMRAAHETASKSVAEYLASLQIPGSHK
jgi:cytochrome c553